MFIKIDSERLKHALAVRGLSQRDLARLAGLREATISRLMNGHPVREATLNRISVALLRVKSLPVSEYVAAPEEQEQAREPVNSVSSRTKLTGA